MFVRRLKNDKTILLGSGRTTNIVDAFSDAKIRRAITSKRNITKNGKTRDLPKRLIIGFSTISSTATIFRYSFGPFQRGIVFFVYRS